MSPKIKALLLSFGRVFAAALLTAYLGLGKAPLDLDLGDLKVLLNAALGALALTVVNYLRSGETRFGRGSEDIGMGGADTLDPPDGVIQTPDGPVNPPREMLNNEEPLPFDEEPPFEDEEPFEEEFEPPAPQPLVRSVPLAEVRAAAKKIAAPPVKRSPTKRLPPAP